MAGAVIVTGLDDIQRKLAASGPAVNKAMSLGLRQGAEPVAKIAEVYSNTRISGMRRGNPRTRPAWAVTRIGVTRHLVYIVPKERGRRFRGQASPWRNLVPLMMTESFEPALEAGRPIVEERVLTLLGEVTRAF